MTRDDLTKLRTMGHYEQAFARPSKHGYNLKELIFINGDCVFLKDGQCSVYHNRPAACRVFPFSFSGKGSCVDSACPHAGEFKKDPVFMEMGKNEMEKIVGEIERSIRIYRESES